MDHINIANSGNLSSQLVTSELGVFSLFFSGEHITTLLPTFTISTCETLTNSLGETETIFKDVIIQPLEEDYRLETLQLSITAIKEQTALYTPESFQPLITEVLEERDPHRVFHGSVLMKNELNTKIYSIAARLERALNRGGDAFYLEFIKLMRELDDKDNSMLFVDGPPPEQKEFLELAVTQHEDIPTLLRANWFEAILEALWYGDLRYKAYKVPVLNKSVPKIILELSTSRLPEVNPRTNNYEVSDQLWIDLGYTSTAGLSPHVVNAILDQHDQATLIDVLKLFTTIWNDHREVQRSHRYTIDGRWAGIVNMLRDRYGTASGNGAQTDVKYACRLLESIRWGTGYDNHIKLLTFDGLERNQDLTVTYLGGFRLPIENHERLVPILNHPKGRTQSRASYNRLGLALGTWLVEHSDTYLVSKIGVKLDDKAYRYFMQTAGFKRRDRLKKAFDAFEESGAIIRENGLLGLGEANEEGKKLILGGAEIAKRAAQGGRKSKRKRPK